MQLVDSHCHLDDERLTGANISEPEQAQTLAEVISRAAQAGVEYIQTIGTSRADFAVIHPIALKYPKVFCSFGVHPHCAGEEAVTYEEIIANGRKQKVIGIGETGLDYFYDNAPRDIQKTSFRMHLKAAAELGLPCIIHSRDAEDDTIEILEEFFANTGFASINQGQGGGSVNSKHPKLLLHCFSSNQKLAEYAVKNSIYISASGIITFGKADAVREAIAQVPLELLLIETDAPYLAPTPHRGKTNEPAYTLHVAEKLAEIKNVSLEEIARVTTDNFFKLFSKAEKS